MSISPHTGWTREHWTAAADGMLASLDPFWSPGDARIDLPGPPSRHGRESDGLEGYARTLLLAGFRVAGEDGDPTGLLERYARGLAVGTDPTSAEAWPRPDELGQAKVEAASIALVLQLTRKWLWDNLDSAVQERTIAWLATVIGQEYPPINWVWFRVIVESFLRSVGGPWSAEDIEQDLAVHASLRRADGWISDGQERAYDHYTGWALHLYPLLWAHWFDGCPPELREQWTVDLARYLEDAVHLVGADGSPLLQGRSLTYRFAAAAPFWMGALVGVGRPGQLRRAASGMLDHFLSHGALSPDGVLTLGWHHAWPALKQDYSGPGSPYWAAKGMLGLALPASHPVWTAVEEPLPAEEGETRRVITAPGWLARTSGGIATIVNHGTDHAHPDDQRGDSPLYAKLAYSTATAPTSFGDNTVVLLSGGIPSHRSGFRTLYVRELPGGVLAGASRGRVRWVEGAEGPDFGYGRAGRVTPGPVVTVVSLVRAGLEVRLVRVDDPAGGDWGLLRLSGWPIADPTEVGDAEATSAGSAVLRSRLDNLRGFTASGTDVHHDASPLGAVTAIPWLSAPTVLGEVFAAAVRLDRGLDSEPLPEVVGTDRVAVAWYGGPTTEVTF
jgi:hypothetical protein